MLQRFFVLLLLFGWSSGFSQNSEDLAESYYKKAEFNKALIIYKNLLKEKPFSSNYINKLVDIHQQLEQYEEAEQILVQRLARSRNPELVIALGYNFQLRDSITKANTLYDEAITYVDEKPIFIYSIARQFENYSLLDQAIKVYEKGKILTPDKNYSIQLARIYADQGNVTQMLENYIDYIHYKPNYLNNVKRSISEFISENKENENNSYLRRLLLKKIQQNPETYWYEMLSWLYVQEKAYNKSFIQEKALYKRNPESIDRLIELAVTAQKDNDDDTAKSIFNYILGITQDSVTALTAHQYILEIDTKNADDKTLKQINETYNNLLTEYGNSKLSLSLQLAYGKFLAFNLRDTEAATRFLKKSLKLNISMFQEAKVKLLLADILVLQEKFNEALIFYSQIQANLKNSTIAQEARFKVAKTSYYKGDFDWAESQLKILKSSTSQLIANDALDLKLLISDNKFEDSTQTALKYYAKADLFAFQNKNDEAISLLDKILEEHKGESITDQALYQQAKLYEKKKQYTKAEANYQNIIKDYGEDILVDDTLYYLAELYNNHLAKPEEAKLLYEKIIFEHQDSIYFIEARKKFRVLRGDSIN
ncbi:tetratricopeptide repeat protein [Winogradskyella pacifica]|jgi:tetratricopeptide (TPR) repeat protein|uniref:Tetratricopeptide repeat protein n=1 Tax=Winogradskyella pacifica TaxID=664642 RepID=A0A3D9N4I6_9FLAO|nr:tetratricopeptide repeat protein [Winogradskyella pacifica]REE27817.1 tetratricopeptide repeat protein [Winogradskyella pacifica]